MSQSNENPDQNNYTNSSMARLLKDITHAFSIINFTITNDEKWF